MTLVSPCIDFNRGSTGTPSERFVAQIAGPNYMIKQETIEREQSCLQIQIRSVVGLLDPRVRGSVRSTKVRIEA
jgi:hypothetical protein